jgi:hypothetical protein
MKSVRSVRAGRLPARAASARLTDVRVAHLRERSEQAPRSRPDRRAVSHERPRRRRRRLSRSRVERRQCDQRTTLPPVDVFGQEPAWSRTRGVLDTYLGHFSRRVWPVPAVKRRPASGSWAWYSSSSARLPRAVGTTVGDPSWWEWPPTPDPRHAGATGVRADTAGSPWGVPSPGVCITRPVPHSASRLMTSNSRAGHGRGVHGPEALVNRTAGSMLTTLNHRVRG